MGQVSVSESLLLPCAPKKLCCWHHSWPGWNFIQLCRDSRLGHCPSVSLLEDFGSTCPGEGTLLTEGTSVLVKSVLLLERSGQCPARHARGESALAEGTQQPPEAVERG